MNATHIQIGKVVQQLHGVFYFTRKLDGTFQYVSSNMSHILGYTVDEFLNHSDTYLTNEPGNQLVERYSQLSCEGIQQAPYEINVFHQNGGRKWLMVSETPRFDGYGNLEAVDGLALDITSQKQMQEELLSNLQTERQQFETQANVQQQTLKQTGRIRKLWKDTQRSYELEKKRYHAIIHNSFDAILILDRHGNIKGSNPAASKIFGWKDREFKQKNIHDIIPSFYCNEGCNPDYFSMMHELVATNRSGQSIYLEVIPSLIKLRDETFISITIRDVTAKKEADALVAQQQSRLESRVSQRTAELKHANQQLQELAEKMGSLNRMDGLTCIFNRRGFDYEFDREWKRAMRSHSPIAVIMIDIDHFKLFNDRYGHQAGDDCLKKVAATLANSVHRVGDLVCRYGGEEFVIVLPETLAAGAMHVAAKLRSEIESLHIEHEQSSASDYVTISLGVDVVIPEQKILKTDLVQHADNALYEAKKRRNTACLF